MLIRPIGPHREMYVHMYKHKVQTKFTMSIQKKRIYDKSGNGEKFNILYDSKAVSTNQC